MGFLFYVVTWDK